MSKKVAMKISDDKRETIVHKLQQDIDAANRYYQDEIEPKVIERYNIYHAAPEFYAKMFPKLDERSKVVSTDVADTIESTMPAMMKTFFGSTDVVTIQGADGGADDDTRAEKMQELINYQLEKNKFFMTFYQWCKDALITNLGIIKVDWEREYKTVQQKIVLSPEAYESFAQYSSIKIISTEPDPASGSFLVLFEGPMLTKNQPRLMNVLASEFRFSPDATSLNDADFVAHRKIVNIDYLRKQQASGLYSNVETLAEKAQPPNYMILDEQNNDNVSEVVNNTDSGRRKVELYECYVDLNMSDDPDAQLTPMIVTISNGVILRIEENVYERHPFFTLSPRLDPHKIWPEAGFVDLIAQLQHGKTAIMRQMIYNLALSNNSQIGVNTTALEDVHDLLDGKQIVRFNQPLNQCLQPLPAAPLQPWTFNMLDYLDSQRENRTGITRYNQGLDDNSLNKTATGVSIITQQANQRLELIARIFAETGLSDLFRFLIKLNQMFIDEDTVIRLTNGPMTIKPDDLTGEFDLVVNAGMGAGAKQTNLQNLQMLQGITTQLSQIGMAGPQQIYNVAKRMIEEIGYKNVDDFVIPPDEMQQQEAPKEDPVSESMRIDLDNAPWQIKMQYYAKQGFQVSDDMFTEQAAQDVLKTAADAHAKAEAMRGDNIARGQRIEPARSSQQRSSGTGDAGFNPPLAQQAAGAVPQGFGGQEQP